MKLIGCKKRQKRKSKHKVVEVKSLVFQIMLLNALVIITNASSKIALNHKLTG